MVLLAGADGQSWCEAAHQVARELGIPLQALRVGLGGDLSEMDADTAWADTYGVQRDGAVLVRPDGYVAWRRRTTTGYQDRMEPHTELGHALEKTLGYDR